MHERQWLLQNKLVMFLAAIAAISMAPAVVELVQDSSQVLILLPILLVLLIFTANLSARLDADAIRLAYWPFWARTIALADVEGFRVGPHRPIRDFGGYGIRLGRGFVAYTVHGKQSVRLQLAGRHVVLGTQRPGEWADALRAAGLRALPPT